MRHILHVNPLMVVVDITKIDFGRFRALLCFHTATATMLTGIMVKLVTPG
jgi:hypothetical protein